jgi:hypothetical protein
MILWDHPNFLTLSSSAYKKRGALMEEVGLEIYLGKFSLVRLSWLASGVSLSNFCSFELCFVKTDF